MKNRWFYALVIPWSLALTISVFPGTARTEGQLRSGGIIVSPGDSDFWSLAGGMDAQVILWSEYVGIGISTGYSEWLAKDQIDFASTPYYAIGVAASGKASVVPFGISLFLRTSARKKANLVVEAGYRYFVVGSSIAGAVEYRDQYNYYTTEGTIGIANTGAGILAADVEFRGNSDTSLFLGAGAQIGANSSAEFKGSDLGGVKLSGLLLRAGLNVRF